MTENDFYILSDKVITQLQYKKEYTDLCKNLWHYDNYKELSKKEAEEIKSDFQIDFKVAGSERLYYKDYFIDDVQLRFMIPYRSGMIDSSYRVFKGLTDNSIPSLSFRRIVQEREDNDPKYTFPIVSSIEEFRIALKLILEINEQIILSLKNEIEK